MNVYLKAIEELETRGWGKHRLLDEKTGCVCIVGAVALAAGMSEDDLLRIDLSGNENVYMLPEVRRLNEVVKSRNLADYMGPIDRAWEFNDDVNDVSDVKDLLAVAAQETE